MAKKKSKKAHPEQTSGSERRSVCPVAATLDLLGDKWTLLVVRDLMAGGSTYSELADSPEGIPTNLLADRLRRLVDAGLVTKEAYQQNPPRYSYKLTRVGLALRPVLKAMASWGLRNIPDTEARIRFETPPKTDS